jgi:hypothetical protein
MKECKFEGCTGKVHARGWCHPHYRQWFRYGVVEELRAKGQWRTPREKKPQTFCHCGAPVKSRGLCATHYGSEYYLQGKAEKGTGRPRQSYITNATAHQRIKSELGKASNYQCADCEEPALDWSLNHDASETHIGVGVNGFGRAFSLDIYSYEPRCRKCHMIYDGTLGLAARIRASE